MNHKQLLADFYLKLLSIDPNNDFRLYNQSLYAMIRDTLAKELDCDGETVQTIFERMAKEDSRGN